MSGLLPSDFRTVWVDFHGELSPIRWVLRESNVLPWLRLHFLPNGQRYANNILERAEILCRAEMVGNRILGIGGSCWLVQGKTSMEGGDSQFIGKFSDEATDELFLYAREVKWSIEEYSELISAIADDRAGPTLWMSTRDGSVFSPYDGGIDLFPAREVDVDALKREFEPWLSNNSSGL